MYNFRTCRQLDSHSPHAITRTPPSAAARGRLIALIAHSNTTDSRWRRATLIPQGTTTEIVDATARGATDPEIETETDEETATVERAASEMTGTAEIVGTATATATVTASHTTAARAPPLAAVSDHETVETATAADGTATMIETGAAVRPRAALTPARQPHLRQTAGETDSMLPHAMTGGRILRHRPRTSSPSAQQS